MPGAEARNLGSEGAVHVSVTGVGGGGTLRVGEGRGGGRGGDWGRRKQGPWWGPTEQEVSLLPRTLAVGEPWPAARRDDGVCFMKKTPSVQGHLW